MERILFISPSSQDKKTWIMTIIIGILPLAFAGWKTFRHTSGFTHWAILFTIILIILITGFVSTPYKYILTNTHLIIKRYWRDISIPLSEIKIIHLMPATEKKTVWRSFGYGGPFGFFGYFSSKKYTKLHVFARRYDNWTLVITDRRKYVIAPDDLQLIDIATQQIGQVVTDDQPIEKPAIQWRRWIPAIIIIVVVVIIYLAYKEPKVEIDSNTFRLKGLYGMNVPFIGMNAADTISWREMPAISVRTNGISLFKVQRGHFRTTNGDKIRLNIHNGVSPVIRIVDSDGIVYYINRRSPTETRQIFNKMQENFKTDQP